MIEFVLLYELLPAICKWFSAICTVICLDECILLWNFVPVLHHYFLMKSRILMLNMSFCMNSYLKSVTESVNEKKYVTLPCIVKGWGYNTLT